MRRDEESPEIYGMKTFDREIPPDLPLPKGGNSPLFEKEGRREIFEQHSTLRAYSLAIIVVSVLSFLPACSTELEFGKKKFERVHHTTGELKGSIHNAVNYERFGELLNELSAEITAIEVNSRKEGELLKGYRDLLTIYRDSQLLWKYRNEFARYGFVPKGLIYVGQDVEPIAEKYHIAVTNHIYKPTMKEWKSIPEDSIRIVWMNADSQLKLIDNMSNY